MPDPTITIGSPSSGDTVTRTFTVSGTYTPTTDTPAISIALLNAQGGLVTSNPDVKGTNGSFSGQLTSPQALSGATVGAGIPATGAHDTVTNITVQ
jgi:hypothetical protein